jgi:hypothetical protein
VAAVALIVVAAEEDSTVVVLAAVADIAVAVDLAMTEGNTDHPLDIIQYKEAIHEGSPLVI